MNSSRIDHRRRHVAEQARRPPREVFGGPQRGRDQPVQRAACRARAGSPAASGDQRDDRERRAGRLTEQDQHHQRERGQRGDQREHQRRRQPGAAQHGADQRAVVAVTRGVDRVQHADAHRERAQRAQSQGVREREQSPDHHAASATRPLNSAASTAISAHRSPIGKTTIRFEPVRRRAGVRLHPGRRRAQPGAHAGLRRGRRAGRAAASSCRAPYQVSVMCRTVCSRIAVIASGQAYGRPIRSAPAASPA